MLQGEFPCMWTIFIASPTIGQDADFFCMWILKLTYLLPPPYNVINGELWGIVGASDEKCTFIGMQINVGTCQDNVKGVCQAGSTRKSLSTEGSHGGGSPRSSDPILLMTMKLW